MASVTAEVLLYFGTDDPGFRRAVDRIRFELGVDNSQGIINLLTPIYDNGYNLGYSDAKTDFGPDE